MLFSQKRAIALLAFITVAIWGIAIFFLFSDEKRIPSKDHETHYVQVENKKIITKNKSITIEKKVNLTKVKSNVKDNRISIDVLLAEISK